MSLDNFEVDTAKMAYAIDLIRELTSTLIGEGLDKLDIVAAATEFLDDETTGQDMRIESCKLTKETKS